MTKTFLLSFYSVSVPSSAALSLRVWTVGKYVHVCVWRSEVNLDT